MEDFGARNIGGLIDAGEAARPYFLRAAELLARLHARLDTRDAAFETLPVFNAGLFADQAGLFLDAYLPFMAKREATDDERRAFREAWVAVLRPLEQTPQSLMLRDFMADNLMDTPRGLGVLDFQDAGLGPTAYDLASLCEEVRRDGGFALLPDVVVHYRSSLEKEGGTTPAHADLMRACTILSAQRHMRVLGIVARLAVRAGRRDKLDSLPRITAHLRRILDEPGLLPVKMWMEEAKIWEHD